MTAFLRRIKELINGMFEKNSKKVLVTVVCGDGSRGTHVARTIDGKWKADNFLFGSEEIVAWMPFPEPYRESEEQDKKTQ